LSSARARLGSLLLYYKSNISLYARDNDDYCGTSDLLQSQMHVL